MRHRTVLHLIPVYCLTWTLIAGTAFLTAVPAAHAQKVLRYQFRPEEKRDVLIDQNIRIAMEIGDQNLTMQVKQDIQYRHEVTEVSPEGDARIRQRVTHIKMASTGIPQVNFSFDSQSAEEPEGIAALVAPIFRSLLSGDVTLFMSSQGAIRDITLPEEFVAASQQAGGLPGVSELLSKDTLTQMMKESAVSFPTEGLRVGDSWTESVTTNAPTGGTQTINTTYTYLGEEEVDGRVLDKIGVVLKIEFGGAPAGVQLKITEQQSDGALYFDNVAGEFVRSSSNQKIKMDVTAGDNLIKQTIETDVKVTNRPAAQP